MKHRGSSVIRTVLVWLCFAVMLVPTGTAGETIGRRFRAVMRSPVRISSAGDQKYIVTDERTHRIFIVDRSREIDWGNPGDWGNGIGLKPGKIRAGFGNTGIQSFQVEAEPLSVAWFHDHIYVGFEGRNELGVYEENGALVGRVSGPAGMRPSDMAVDASRGFLFVSDTAGHGIHVFDANGYRFSMPGDVAATPTGIAVDSRRHLLWISDFGDRNTGIVPRLRCVTYDGLVVQTIIGETAGRMGFGGTFTFSRPQGLAVDEQGNVYMVDSYAGEILVFDGSGSLLCTIGGMNDPQYPLRLPLDVIYSTDTHSLYVTDNRNGRVATIPVGGAE